MISVVYRSSETVIEHESITQIKVIYVSVQPLHNRHFVIPHKCWIDGFDKQKVKDQLR